MDSEKIIPPDSHIDRPFSEKDKVRFRLFKERKFPTVIFAECPTLEDEQTEKLSTICKQPPE